MADRASSEGSQGQVDLATLIARLFGTRPAQIAWFLALSLLTRVSTFGDPGYHNDELFYFLVGQRMHDGLLPYVDLWDRKGPGLFLTYYAVAAFGHAVIAYQIAAMLFAAATAWVANLIAERWAGRMGAMMGGSLYLVLLPLFAGGGGQAPVFYNLWVALAALGVVSALPRLREGNIPRRVWLAMLAAGFAITFKQTAAVEGAFFGMFVLWQLHRGGMAPLRLVPTALALAVLGAAPMVLFGACYAAIGHFAEFWHAMVTTNLIKPYDPGGDQLKRIVALLTVVGPALLLALASLFLPGEREQRGFLVGWLIAAALGVALVPNFIDHYMLPFCLPVAVAAARALEHGKLGPAYGYAILLFGLIAGPAFHFAERRQSRADMEVLARDIRMYDSQPRLLVFQGPVQLYGMLGGYPPTPLFMPTHLFHRPENDTSHLDTAGEVRKILAWEPTIVVTGKGFPGRYDNPETTALVAAYVARCGTRFERPIVDYYGEQTVRVYADCATPPLVP